MSRRHPKGASNVEVHLFGRVSKRKIQDRRADRKADRQLSKNLASLERTRDRLPRDSAAWQQADKAIEGFKRRNGL